MQSLWTDCRLARDAAAIDPGTFTIIVADRQSGDYAPLLAVPRRGVWWQFLATARHALAAARNGPVDLWIVNTSLPDRSGVDLCHMLREGRAAEVFLVADHYDPREELAARTAGAMFACKPVQADWLEGLIPSDRRRATTHRSTA